jgi:hypothetical protein
MMDSRSGTQPIALVAILLLGLALRLAPWGQNRFLEDEALYAYWGLQIATGADPMLDEEPVDKPPLHLYTLALSLLASAPSLVTGVGAGHETAARLPSLLASLSGILLVYALARALYGDQWVALLAALLLALSPFDLLFASTAFTDPLMTALVLGALGAAGTDRPGTAGLLAGLAAATKQQGLFFLPLVLAVAMLSPHRDRSSPGPAESKQATGARAWLQRVWRRRWVRFTLGLALIVASVLWWDAARAQRPGFFEQSLISYGGLGPAQPETLGTRAVEWLRMVGGFWSSPWYNGLVLAAAVGWLLLGWAGRAPGPSRLDLALGLFILVFLLGHWLLGFQVWDRYLLGLVPLAALLSARAFVGLGRGICPATWWRIYASGLVLIVAAALAVPSLQAMRSELPLGGDHGAYDGIDHLATYMRSQAPPGSVLYHYWLGYHYHFYLYGAPLRLHWYPDLDDLVSDAYVYRRDPGSSGGGKHRPDAGVRDAPPRREHFVPAVPARWPVTMPAVVG